jgi:glycopeptide antibiotics resistance protein
VVATIAFIIYGSLYPFHFDVPWTEAGPDSWKVLTFQPSSKGDLLANVLLYAPFGAVFTLLLGRWSSGGEPRQGVLLFRTLAVIALPVAGATLALSLGLEMLQTLESARVASLTDVAMNVLGALAGATLVAAIRTADYARRGIAASTDSGSVAALVIIGLWVLGASLPWVPTLDWQKYKDALKPLVDARSLDGVRAFSELTGWLVVAFALEQLTGRAGRLPALLVVLAVTLLAQVVVIDNALSPEELLGAGLALILVVSVPDGPPRLSSASLAVLLAASFVIGGLAPFTFSSASSPFGWVPFRGTLESGSPLGAIATWFEKTFVYVALSWLLLRAGAATGSSITIVGVIVLGVELLQRHVPGRTPEITDPLVAVLMSAFFLLCRDGTRPWRVPSLGGLTRAGGSKGTTSVP